MADETGKSDVLNPYGLNPNSGKPMPWARESLAVSLFAQCDPGQAVHLLGARA